MKLHFVAFLVFHMVCFLLIVKEFGTKSKEIRDAAKVITQNMR